LRAKRAQFCIFQKRLPFCPQEWGAMLAGGKRLSPTEAKLRQGVDDCKSFLFKILIHIAF